MPIRIWGGDIWGGGKDGTAQVDRVIRQSSGLKYVTFWSVEGNKRYTIKKTSFLRRFPKPVNTREHGSGKD